MTVVFNFFDEYYSGEFLKSWINLSTYLNSTGIHYHISHHSSCNAFYAKQMCLGGNVLVGDKQIPYQNNIKYDMVVFLSNKIAFSATQFITLYNKFTDYDFLSARVDGRYKTLTEDRNYIKAEYLDFDFVFVRKGVFEQLEYPWFRPHVSTTVSEQQFIDIDICRRIRKQNIDLTIDKNVDLHGGNYSFVTVHE
tara:strand:- start:1095 stop:1676 length:582 start_codon:yes stop_codon:yes gene_type:complete